MNPKNKSAHNVRLQELQQEFKEWFSTAEDFGTPEQYLEYLHLMYSNAIISPIGNDSELRLDFTIVHDIIKNFVKLVKKHGTERVGDLLKAKLNTTRYYRNWEDIRLPNGSVIDEHSNWIYQGEGEPIPNHSVLVLDDDDEDIRRVYSTEEFYETDF